MPITRRQLLLHCLTAGLLSWLLPARAAKPKPAPSLAETIRVYLDILIPADETPGAGQLGIEQDLLQKGKTDAMYRQILKLGVAWLDRQAREMGGEDFVSLEESVRVSIVSRAAAAASNTVEGLFFQGTRIDAFQFYYARPAGWQGIAGYHGPPQPLGYMDQHRPPGN